MMVLILWRGQMLSRFCVPGLKFLVIYKHQILDALSYLAVRIGKLVRAQCRPFTRVRVLLYRIGFPLVVGFEYEAEACR